MSTGATIQVDDVYFYQSHDGYPYDIWYNFSADIEIAKKRAAKNPDYPFFANLKYVLMEAEVPFSIGTDGFPSEYSFKVDEDGKIYALNPAGMWVEIKYEMKDNRPQNLIVKTTTDMLREFEDWDDYEERFDCDKCGNEMKYRMVDIDGTNLEEHMVCPKCGYDEGAM